MDPIIIVLNIAFVVIGMAMLYFGGSGLVKGASGIALNLSIPSLIVGLTVVAFGTSAPELFVSVLSALQGKMGVSIGNVLGSNVINIALILGISILAIPASVDRNVIRFDAPFMLATYLLVALAALDFANAGPLWINGTIARLEGVVLIGFLIGYVYLLYRRSRTADPQKAPFVEEMPSEEDTARPLWLDGVFVFTGVALLAVGAELLVRGASDLATDLFGASERFVGIAIVAFGTSLPELFTTIASISRREMDISVGNIVGSNIFNSLMVLGTTAAIRPIEVGNTDYRLDFAFMTVTTVVLLTFLFARGRVPRWGGGLFLAIYATYFVFLMMTRTV